VSTHCLHCTRALLPDGWASHVRLEFADGKFARIERETSPQPGDERVAVALPGLGNVHSHGFQRGMAGLTEYRGPEADNFWSWRELMYRFVGRMTPDDLEAITALAYVEMLEGGFTRVGEFHYVHHDVGGAPYANGAEMAARVVAAAHTTGIALTLLPVFYAHGNFGGAPAMPGQRHRDTFVAGLRRRFALDAREFSVGEFQSHITGPAIGQQRASTVQAMGGHRPAVYARLPRRTSGGRRHSSIWCRHAL